MRHELSSQCRPEFLNRLDEIIVFCPLTKTKIGSIAELMLKSVQKRAAAKGVTVTMDDTFRVTLLKQDFSPMFGTRPMRRSVQRVLENPLAECLLDGSACEGDTLFVSADAKGVRVRNKRGVSKTFEHASLGSDGGGIDAGEVSVVA